MVIASKGSRDRHKSLTNGAKKVSLILHPPSSSHNGKRFIWEELEAAVGDDGKKTFGSGQIDKLKNGTMYNNSSTNVSIYRLAVTQKLCTTKAFFFKAKPRHFEVLDSPIRNSRFGAIKGASQQ